MCTKVHLFSFLYKCLLRHQKRDRIVSAALFSIHFLFLTYRKKMRYNLPIHILPYLPGCKKQKVLNLKTPKCIGRGHCNKTYESMVFYTCFVTIAEKNPQKSDTIIVFILQKNVCVKII